MEWEGGGGTQEFHYFKSYVTNIVKDMMFWGVLENLCLSCMWAFIT